MTLCDLRLLPFGTSTFSALRGAGQVYVDKTALIRELASLPRGKVFLSRPRRFGKSLLVSTFESLFSSGITQFSGLAIEPLWNEKRYRVVRLDFSYLMNCADEEEFQQIFGDVLADAFGTAGFQPDAGTGIPVWIQLGRWLGSQPHDSLVLLIDEYDSPLTEVLDRPELFAQYRRVLNRFFTVLKSNEGCLRFFFMTGITKLSSTSIFSAFNNLLDISLDPRFGTLLGYTEEEIRHSFGPWLTRAGQILNLSEEQLLSELRAHYDGFCFDEKASTHVYCPWSVLNFLLNPESGFRDFWCASGGKPAVLQAYLKGHALSRPESYAARKEIPLEALRSPNRYEDLSLDTLLVQAGYLTIKAVTEDKQAVLGFPNAEVSQAMAQLYASELLQGRPLRKPGEPLVSAILATGTLDDVAAQFNKTANMLDGQRYPIRDEATCRGYFQVLLYGAAMIPQVEVHSALGRSDLEVDSGNRRWVFEFKFARPKDDPAALLKEGLEQIRSRRYGESPRETELIRAALVFSEEERRFVAWGLA